MPEFLPEGVYTWMPSIGSDKSACERSTKQQRKRSKGVRNHAEGQPRLDTRIGSPQLKAKNCQEQSTIGLGVVLGTDCYHQRCKVSIGHLLSLALHEVIHELSYNRAHPPPPPSHPPPPPPPTPPPLTKKIQKCTSTIISRRRS